MSDVRIGAEPLDEARYKFTVNHPVHGMGSGAYRFVSPEDAAGVPVAEAVLGVPGIAEVILSDRSVTVARSPGVEWCDLEDRVQYAISTAVTELNASQNAAVASQPMDDDTMYDVVAEIFRVDINPTVAQHGGAVELIDVQDATVVLRMMGGCQGVAWRTSRCGRVSRVLSSGRCRASRAFRTSPIIPLGQIPTSRQRRNSRRTGGEGEGEGDPAVPRLLLLLPTTTYRADDFVDAAASIGVALTVASEVPSSFQDRQPADFLTLDLDDPAAAAAAALEFAEQHPISAVVGVDDHTVVAAASISSELGLPSNSLSSVTAASSKAMQRKVLRECGVPVPNFGVHSAVDDPAVLASATAYPCVLKPVSLSASRGVIRADDPDEFLSAHERLIRIIKSAEAPDQRFLVEQFIPGPEFALEGLVVNGALHVLALFDKPDPLDGPFFEETIYVTPSRHDRCAQRSITHCAQRAVTALGLVRGPVHIELRFNEAGAWLIEMAARPIGGKCGRVLRFGEEGKISLETLILTQAMNTLVDIPPRESLAAGVMMIPIPRAGVLREVNGVEIARDQPGVKEVLISAHRGQELVPLPEGSRYLGFIFARGETPELVEAALRDAHASLDFEID